MKKILTIIFLFGLIALSCKKDKQPAPPFLNTEWTLSYIENVSTKLTFNFPADAINKITLVFPETGEMNFTGICNTGTGKFLVDFVEETVGGISITDLVLTKIGCPYVEWESYVTQSLGKAFLFQITENTLAIKSTGDFNLYLTKL